MTTDTLNHACSLKEELATFKMRRLADRLGYNIKAPASVKDGVFHGEDELLRSLSTKEGGAK